MTDSDSMVMSRSFIILVTHIFLAIPACDSKVFMLGTLFSWGGWNACGRHGCGGAVSVAVDEINSDPVTFNTFHSQGHRLAFTYADTNCEAAVGLPRIPEMYFGSGFPPVDAFIGPGCSVICEPGGHMAKQWNVPMISFICTSTKLSDKTLYPTFARTAAPSYRTAPFFREMMRHYGYDRAAIFYSSHNLQILSALAIKEQFDKDGLIVTDLVIFEPGASGREQERQNLLAASRNTRGKYSTNVLDSKQPGSLHFIPCKETIPR